MKFKLWLNEVVADETEIQKYLLQFQRSEDPKKLYRKLIFSAHPDQGGDEQKFKAIQTAWEKYKKYPTRPTPNPNSRTHSNPGARSQWHSTDTSNPNEKPEWQTDTRATWNGIGKDWSNLNKCLYDIWVKAKENGPVKNWQFIPFDGNFLRSSLTAKCNEKTFHLAGKIVEYWSSHGANPYPTEAVLAIRYQTEHDSSDIYAVTYIIRIKGKDISSPGSGMSPGILIPRFDQNSHKDLDSLRKVIKIYEENEHVSLQDIDDIFKYKYDQFR